MAGMSVLERQKKAKSLLLQQERRRKKRIYGVEDGLRSPATQKQYAWHFNAFLKHTGLTEEDIVIRLGQNPKDPRNKELEAIIIQYLDGYLNKEKKLSPSMMTSTLAAILHFCDMNDIQLNRKKLNRFVPPDESARYDRPYTHDEIERLLRTADERIRVVVLLMANGVREGGLTDLEFGDLEEMQIGVGSRNPQQQQVYKAFIYGRSRKDRYYTFLTPETYHAINEYMEYRQRFGEEIKKTSPLIREQFDVRFTEAANNPRKLSLPGLSKLIERALTNAGLYDNKKDDKDKDKDHPTRTNGFRKFAITAMKKADVDFSDREYLVGHKVSRGLDVNYDRTSEEDRLLEWSKAIDNLTINQAYRLKKKLQKIEGEQEHQIARLKAQLYEKDAESKALWDKQRETDNKMKTFEERLRTAGLIDSCD
jgi:hypothetical protein